MKTFRLRWSRIVLAVLTICLLFTLVLFISSLGISNRGPRRALPEAEIAALSAALELYHADHGHYPTNADTERLRPDSDFSPKAYIAASKLLYRSLGTGNKIYFEFHPPMLKQDSDGQTYIVDPKGRSYGYSTLGIKNGTNLFDLWSTDGGSTASATNRWISNW